MKHFLQSIESRLLLLIFIVVLPSMSVLLYYSILDRNKAIEESLQHAIKTVEAITVEQAQVIQQTEVFLSRLSIFPQLLTPSDMTCQAFLNNVLRLSHVYENLEVALTNGEVVCSGSGEIKDANIIDEPYVQRALENKGFSVGGFQINKISGVLSIHFSYPIIQPGTSEVLALLVATIPLNWWNIGLLEAYLPADTMVYIIDQKQKMIANYSTNAHKPGVLIDEAKTTEIVEKFSNFNQAKIINSDDGHTRIFVTRPLVGDHLSPRITLGVGIPFDEQLAQINSRMLNIFSVVIFFVIVMAIIAMLGVKNSITGPLKLLIKLTKNLEEGKSEVSFQKYGATELIDLQNQFSLMAKTRLDAEKKLKSSQALLQQNQRLLSSHIENTPLGCISWDIKFNCIEWNKSAEKIFGYSAEEAIGCHVTDLIITQHFQKEAFNIFEMLLAQSGGHLSTNENATKNGDLIVCEWYNTPILDSNGIVIGIASLILNVTERKRLEERLTTAASVFSHAREGIVIADSQGWIIDMNDTVEEITGFTRDDVLGEQLSFFQLQPEGSDLTANILKSLKETGHWYGENASKRKNNEIYPQLLTISTVYDDYGKVKNYVALFTDITSLKDHQKQLEHIAHYDLLTNLPNRTLLADRLKQAITQSKRHKQSLAVTFLDLDGFKAINDVYGHTIGDEFLVAIAHRMKAALRDGDTLARFGGDEFVAILVDLESDYDCEPILERLLRAASETIVINDTVLRVTASIGVTLTPQDHADADQLIRHADQAMYIAKQQGKNCYHFFDTVSDDAIKIKRETIRQISHGLTKNEFVLHYQPKVNMRTGEVIGVEALIRWDHPESGLLYPVDFLPYIENHTVSIDIGEWVINQVLIQIEKWKQQNTFLSVSVNIDALELQQRNFPARLARILALHPNIDPGVLQLEVLETSAFGNIMDASEIMKQCIKLGVNFAIDDFGTGYSSLTYLRRLPVSMIKIDQTFIRDMLDDSEDLAIVLGVVGLAASFDRGVIAEGVETIKHGTVLLELGCELAQGNGIARAMPAGLIPQWCNDWKIAPEWQI